MVFKGSELIVEALRRENIDTIFGYPGGVVIPVFDVLYDAKDINVILTRHEQAAVHAADAYARTTGKTGVCLVTSGPGVTNTITGLATANFDSVPLVCISGQVPRKMIGNDAFQEADTVGLTRPVTKHNYIVTERDKLGKTLKDAFYIASTGRPGPVVIDIPKDIILQPEEESYPETVSIMGYAPPEKGHKGQIKRAANLINKAKKPVLFAGGGINVGNAAEVFREIVNKTGIPAVNSLMGIGSLETENPLNLGMLGMHGTYAANKAITDSDVIFGIGVRFDDRVTMELDKFAPHAKIVHLDIDPAAIARNVAVEVPIVGDAQSVLTDMLPLLEPLGNPAWTEQIKAWKEEAVCRNAYEGFHLKEEPTEHLMPLEVLETVNKAFPEAIVTTEVGQNQMWTALYWKFKNPRTFVTSGGLGTMGYGFPAAVGAAIANREKRVVAVSGDGSFQMNLQEMATAVKNNLPVIILILNNGYLGMVRQWQKMFQKGRYSSTHLNDLKYDGEKPAYEATPDFVKLAEAYTARGFRVNTIDELEKALVEIKDIKDKPVIIDCIIEPEADVWPMVPPGAGLGEMVFSLDSGEDKK